MGDQLVLLGQTPGERQVGSGSSKQGEWGGEEVLLLEPAMGLGPGDGSGVWDTG